MSGGTRLADNKDHKEEPITVHRGQEGLERRYLQGEHRENMMHHLETKGEAITRRKKVASSTTVARDRLREKAERDGIQNEFENPSIAGNPGTNMSQASDEDGGGRIEDPLSMATDGSSAEQHEQQRKKAQRQVKAQLQEEGSVHTHISDETSLVNDNGKHVSSRAPGDHSDPRGDVKHMQSTAQLAASMASDGQNQGQDQDQDQASKSPTKQVGFVRGSALDGNSMHSVAEQPPHAFIQEQVQQPVHGQSPPPKPPNPPKFPVLTQYRYTVHPPLHPLHGNQGREAMERPGGNLLKAGVSSVAGMGSITAISKQMGQSLATMDLQNKKLQF